ncbi:DUF4214 domain-containing protein [Sulfitobacter pacificus]|uniref:DUF4214 domain-containing protein n=1 Tax=Sulfitobacter pacificus TaxID=1499314 RepID=UPI0031081CD5
MSVVDAISITLGVAGAALGVGSIVGGNASDATRDAALADIRNRLADIEGLVTAGIDAQIAESISESQTALNELARFSNTEDAALRQDIGQSAIRLANEGLNGVVGQVRAIKDAGLSFEALAHHYAAVSFAIAARQTVAEVVEDGPMGSPGLHEQIKRALDTLNNDRFFGDDIVSAMENLLYDATGVQYVPPSNPGVPGGRPEQQGEASYIIGEPFSTQSLIVGTAVRVTITREITNTFPLEFESEADFKARIDAAVQAATDQAVANVKEDYGITGLETLVRDASTFLAHDPDEIATVYEHILTGDNDQKTGTSQSDYMDGKRGDDILSGEGGPDAILGGEGNDIISGGAMADVLTGGAGDDIIFAGANMFERGTDDTARYHGLSDDYQVRGGIGYAVVVSPDGARDKLFGVEYIRFDDRIIELDEGSALDGAGAPEDFVTAERVALLYEAALNRDGNIDLPGLNFYIGVTERDSLTDEFLAQDLMTSPEFTASFGDANTLSNAAFLEQIYLNVLDRASDAAGRQFYLDLLNAGTISKALALADIAVSPENTRESTSILMGLYENSSGEWSFL